jgi:thioredoxin reductase (NADPH)
VAPALLIGAGAAGIAAALMFEALEQPFRWVEGAPRAGGTLWRVGNVLANVPLAEGQDGPTLAARLAVQVASLGTPLSTERPVRALCPDGAGGWIARIGEEEQHASAVLLATGTRPRPLPVPGADALQGHGIEWAVTKNLPQVAAQVVAIVGGGDGALEGALLLAGVAARVHLIRRGGAFSGQPRFVERVHHHPRITVHGGVGVAGLAQERGHLVGIDLDDGTHLPVARLFVKIGVAPLLPEGIPAENLDAGGYLRTDAEGRCQSPGLWAAGDVTGRAHQSVAWAHGTGARAAAAIATTLMPPERGSRR